MQNQNPLDPLDTNQFTQQLVQFAQVEQQMNMNSQLTTLVSLQKTAQTTAAVGFLDLPAYLLKFGGHLFQLVRRLLKLSLLLGQRRDAGRRAQ